MRRFGLIGGVSWHSTQTYYRLFNEDVARRLGGSHSARVIIASVDFAEIEALYKAHRWNEVGARILEEAQGLRRAGVEFLLIGANTLHRFASLLEKKAGLDVLHIVDPTALAARKEGFSRLGLLGTRFTMEGDFWVQRLEGFGIKAVVPEIDDRKEIDRVIFEELVQGRIEGSSKKFFSEVMGRLEKNGAQGIVLGCTEISLLVSPEDSSLKLFDTTALHAAAAVDRALEGSDPETVE